MLASYASFGEQMSNPYPSIPLGGLFEPPPPLPDETQYYEAIGRFIVAYAACEGAIHQLARKLSGLKDNRARLVFARRHIGDVVDRARDLLKLSKRSPKIKKDIEECLTQFNVIGDQRHKMVHRTTTYARGSLSVSNIWTSKSALGYEQDLFTIDDLRYLLMDCLAIQLRLAMINSPSIGKNMERSFKKSLHAPWFYSPPKSKKRKSPLEILLAGP
jgi:hypothetical protein